MRLFPTVARHTLPIISEFFLAGARAPGEPETNLLHAGFPKSWRLLREILFIVRR